MKLSKLSKLSKEIILSEDVLYITNTKQILNFKKDSIFDVGFTNIKTPIQQFAYGITKDKRLIPKHSDGFITVHNLGEVIFIFNGNLEELRKELPEFFI